MTLSRRLLAGAAALTLVAGVGGGVVAAGLAQAPAQEATPAPASDPIGDMLRNAPPVEAAPAAAAAPIAPIAITPVTPLEAVPKVEVAVQDAKADEKIPEAEKVEEPETPLPRQRRRVAVVEAIDKITAERMRFEVEVGGRPVRFNNALIFSARACEVSATNELVADAIAYMDISIQPRGTAVATEPRRLFRGWMFASTPGVSGLQHPIYDAWVVGCKA